MQQRSKERRVNISLRGQSWSTSWTWPSTQNPVGGADAQSFGQLPAKDVLAMYGDNMHDATAPGCLVQIMLAVK